MAEASAAHSLGGPETPDAPAIQALPLPYLLVLFSVPVFTGADGRRHVDRLWAKDLKQHLAYLPDLTVCCYRGRWPADASGLTCLDDDPAFAGLRIVTLPMPRGLLHALLRAPATAATLWREVARCRVVHSSVAAWPLPEAWFVTPIARRLKRPHVIVVESAFWRTPAQDPRATAWRRAWSRFQERMARRCLDACDLPIFTHDGYRQSLLAKPARGHVIPASWIDPEWLVQPAELQRRQATQAARPGFSLAFFGRLTPEKGPQIALAACRALHAAGLPVTLDLWGEGPLADTLRQQAQEGTGIRLCGTLPYGPPMFEQLGRYDALVVPTTTDEQPRIVFDAYSQGVPVLASDTPGHRECVQPQATGALFQAGSAPALAEAVRTAAADKAGWLAQGAACRARALAHTHQAMHRTRRALLGALLGRP